MEMIACTCGGLPHHDHNLGMHEVDGVYQTHWGRETWEIGRIWVDWKAVARALMRERND